MAWWNPLDWILGPQRVYADPVFGRLTCRRRWRWRGKVHFQSTAAVVDIAIRTGGPEPDDTERSIFLELTNRYDAMRPGIAKALFDLMTEAQTKYGNDIGLPKEEWKPSTPDDMIRATRLDYIDIERPASLRLLYGFARDIPFGGWIFTIRVDDWTPVAEDMRE